MAKTISMCQGKGSLSHNNRTFSAKNIDQSRTADNIVFVRQNLAEAYQQLFGDAVEQYNAAQKRNDRKIPDYFQHLFNREPSASVITGSNKQKSFYEDLVQIGTKDDTGVGTADAETAILCLKEYMDGFQERNPNFHVFNAVMHLDEATPHLHIDYIPVGHFSSGVKSRNAMAKALEEMGYGKGANAINRWRLSEWKVLHDICESHGIEISEPQKSRGYSFTTQEYGEHQDKLHALQAEEEKLDRQIAEKQEKRTTIMTYCPDLEKTKQAETEFSELCEELISLTKNPITAVKNKKRIEQIARKLEKRLHAAHKARENSEYSTYESKRENRKFAEAYFAEQETTSQLRERISEISSELKSLRSTHEDAAELLQMLEFYEPNVYQRMKRMQERTRERERQTQRQVPKKKKSWGLE